MDASAVPVIVHYVVMMVMMMIMSEMKKYYLESRSRGISYMKYVNGR
jgi:hypothetical protein